MQDNKESSFDVRTLARNIAAGRLEQAAVDSQIEGLEDCSEEADWTVTQMAIPPQGEPEASED
jgi:hypothetical protein